MTINFIFYILYDNSIKNTFKLCDCSTFIILFVLLLDSYFPILFYEGNTKKCQIKIHLL